MLPADLGDFKCVILTGDDLPDERRNAICREIVGIGCRWAMTWGPDCELWHDCLDETVLLRHNHSVPDDKFLMTTWHEQESLEEVLFFAKRMATESYDDRPLIQLLVLDLGREARMADVLRLYEMS
jgi:hypothetical protein